MNIHESIQQYIDEGGMGRLATVDGRDGVVFLDENEFIPFDDLGYNRDLGYFRLSAFPQQKNEHGDESPRDD